MKSFYDRIGISTSKCGICYEKSYPCDSCIERTLKTNGLSIDLKKELKRLSHIDITHVWNEYSPFNNKLREIIITENKKIKNNGKNK